MIDSPVCRLLCRVTLVETYQNFWSLLESSRLEPLNPGAVVLPTLLVRGL